MWGLQSSSSSKEVGQGLWRRQRVDEDLPPMFPLQSDILAEPMQ